MVQLKSVRYIGKMSSLVRSSRLHWGSSQVGLLGLPLCTYNTCSCPPKSLCNDTMQSKAFWWGSRTLSGISLVTMICTPFFLHFYRASEGPLFACRNLWLNDSGSSFFFLIFYLFFHFYNTIYILTQNMWSSWDGSKTGFYLSWKWFASIIIGSWKYW